MTQLPWNNIIGRVTVTYDLNQGDIATNTFYVAAVNDAKAVSVLDVDDLVIVITQVRDSIEGMMDGDGSWHSGCTVNRVDGYTLAATGTHDAITKRTVAGTGKHGSSTQALPPEIACATSLYGYDPTQFEEQRARRRGRVYIPGLSVAAVGSSGMFNVSFTQWVADHIAGMGQDLWDAPLSSDLHGDLVVASRTGNYLSEVTLVRVDDHPDVQRRRENRIPYIYRQTGIAR